MEDSMGTVKVITALAVGALIGAGIGILLAPDKGSRTRRRIMNSAQDLADDLKDKISDEAKILRKKANHVVHDASAKVEDLLKTNN